MTDKEKRKELFTLLPLVKPYATRENKLPSEEEARKIENGFMFIVERWIPLQPDAEILLRILFLMDSDLYRFLTMLVRNGPRGGGEPVVLGKAA